MDDATMRISMGLRLGLPLCQSHTCQHCGAEVSHFTTDGISCRKSAGRHHRHSDVNEIIQAVAQQAEDRKKYKHLDSCYFFTPVAIETSGAFGSKTTEFLKELGHQLK